MKEILLKFVELLVADSDIMNYIIVKQKANELRELIEKEFPEGEVIKREIL